MSFLCKPSVTERELLFSANRNCFSIKSAHCSDSIMYFSLLLSLVGIFRCCIKFHSWVKGRRGRYYLFCGYLYLKTFVFCPEMLLRDKCSVIGSCERALDWRQLSAVMGLGRGTQLIAVISPKKVMLAWTQCRENV